MPLTPNQQRAISARDKNFVVIAGAGAGKTRVLVVRYLALLAEGYALPSIVAITFTEKAASEMRDRVRREIDARAANDPRWNAYRAEMDRAPIGTIHSLCARLLRANPVEAGVDPRFEVLEEADAAILQDEIIDAVLTDLAEAGGDALALLNEYDLETIRATLRDLFQRGAMVDVVFAQLPDDVDTLLAEWQTRWHNARRQAMMQLLASDAWRTGAEWIGHHAATKADDKLELVRAEFEQHLRALDACDETRAFDALRCIGTSKVGNVGSKSAWDDLATAKQMVMSLRNLAKAFVDTYDAEIGDADQRAATLVYAWRALWKDGRAKYAHAKTLQRVLDFNDLEEHARDLLLNYPAVRARYRAEFACVLVDEFQDTNAAQRDIVYALAAPHEPNRLFIVADGKQSIYGFRGADVSVFAQTQADIGKHWGADALIPLAESFRAHTRLVDAFNHIFERIFAVEGDRASYEIPYTPYQAMRPSLPREPLIEIIQIPNDSISVGEQREREAEEIARRLRELVEQGFTVWDKKKQAYRTLEWRDIALLFRATTHFSIYEEAFKIADIPYVTLAGKGYYDRAEVRDLLYLLRALDNPLDDLALAIVLRSPLYALSDETLYRLRRDGRALQDVLRVIPDEVTGDERARVEFARASLERLWAQVGRVPIVDLLKHALADTDYLATLTALSDGERRRANVEELLALAGRQGLVRLSEFNAYLRDLTAQEVREGEAVIEAGNAVSLMSIHRAKGLEFPVVVLPDASRAPRANRDTLLADRESGVAVRVRDARGESVKPLAYRLLQAEAMRRERAEEKRLLYVALTRAQDYAIISGGKKADEQSSLAHILAALDGQSSFDWGTIEIREPTVTFENTRRAPVIESPSDAPHATSSAMELPALALPLASPTLRDLQSFTPTGLGLLIHDDRAKFEQHALEGAPERVKPVTRQSARVPAYIVGEIAHRAIQHWRLPPVSNLETILTGYAQARGLTDADETRAAVRQAIGLLQRFVASELYREMEHAVVRQNEVPFVAQWQGRIVHGALDALCQSAEGRWFIVDFKTDRLRGKEARAYTLDQYGTQLAFYQLAVAARLGDVPVRVHYLHDDVTVTLMRADLADALEHARREVETSAASF